MTAETPTPLSDERGQLCWTIAKIICGDEWEMEGKQRKIKSTMLRAKLMQAEMTQLTQAQPS